MVRAMRRSLGPAACALLLIVSTSGCYGYRLIRPEEIEVPSYEPRDVPIPARCDSLVQQAASRGTESMAPEAVGMISFCQGQQILRAQEEEAAARKLEAHAETANFALRLTTVIVGGAIAVLAWVF